MKVEIKLPRGTKETKVKGLSEKGGEKDKNAEERVAWRKHT